MNGGIGEISTGNGGNTAYNKISEVKVGGVEVGQEVGNNYKEALDMILSAPYVAPSFSSFSTNIPNQLELGQKVLGTYAFSFGLNHAQNVLENSISLIINSGIYLDQKPKNSSPLSLTISEEGYFQYNDDHILTFIIKGIEERNNQAFQKSFNKVWYHSIYSGVAQDVDVNTINEAWVKQNLTRTLSNTHLATGNFAISGTLGVNEKLYYVYPVDLGLKKFKTDLGVEGGSLIINGLEIKTASQIAFSLAGKSYVVLRTEQSNLGYITRTLSNF